MKIVILASGSKGNSVYIETNEAKILIDAGISYLQLRTRLAQKNIQLNKLDAILVTHEHSDHVRHLVSIATRTNASIYLSESSYYTINQKYSGGLLGLDVGLIKANAKYKIKDLIFAPIALSHDTPTCFGYIVKEDCPGNITYGYVTDTGYIPEEYINLISKLQVISLESNHDVKMLKESSRPDFLINRILSKNGHLSNVQCNEYLKQFDFKYNKIVILSHLSEECNTEEIAINTVYQTFNNDLPFTLLVAKQNEPLDVIEVSNV